MQVFDQVPYPEAVIIQLADDSGQAVFVYDETATVDANGNVFTFKGN